MLLLLPAAAAAAAAAPSSSFHLDGHGIVIACPRKVDLSICRSVDLSDF